MYFNTFAPGLEPIDMTQGEEFKSLLQSAADLGIAVKQPVRYVSRNVVVNGLRFHCLEWGDQKSTPLLMLHGGNQSAHSWDLVSLNLSDRYHIIAVDQRGHGDSEWPRDGDSSQQGMADDAKRFVELFEEDHPIVMGHSMGGMVTMRLLTQNPRLARKAVFVDIGPERAPSGSEQIGGFISTMHEIDTEEEYVRRVSAYDRFRTPEHIRRTMGYNMLKLVDGKLATKRDQRRIVADGGNTAPGYDEVGKIECPALIVRGESSNILLPEMAERFRAALRQGSLVEVARCGHNVHSQNTVGFLEAVTPFLQR